MRVQTRVENKARAAAEMIMDAMPETLTSEVADSLRDILRGVLIEIEKREPGGNDNK